MQQKDHIVIQRALIALQLQHVVALLRDDLLGDRMLAVERIGIHDGVLQGQYAQQFRFGNLIRLCIGGELRQTKC